MSKDEQGAWRVRKTLAGGTWVASDVEGSAYKRRYITHKSKVACSGETGKVNIHFSTQSAAQTAMDAYLAKEKQAMSKDWEVKNMTGGWRAWRLTGTKSGEFDHGEFLCTDGQVRGWLKPQQKEFWAHSSRGTAQAALDAYLSKEKRRETLANLGKGNEVPPADIKVGRRYRIRATHDNCWLTGNYKIESKGDAFFHIPSDGVNYLLSDYKFYEVNETETPNKEEQVKRKCDVCGKQLKIIGCPDCSFYIHSHCTDSRLGLEHCPRQPCNCQGTNETETSEKEQDMKLYTTAIALTETDEQGNVSRVGIDDTTRITRFAGNSSEAIHNRERTLKADSKDIVLCLEGEWTDYKGY